VSVHARTRVATRVKGSGVIPDGRAGKL
jgi:hypothetical protein